MTTASKVDPTALWMDIASALQIGSWTLICPVGLSYNSGSIVEVKPGDSESWFQCTIGCMAGSLAHASFIISLNCAALEMMQCVDQ